LGRFGVYLFAAATTTHPNVVHNNEPRLVDLDEFGE